MKQSNDNIDVYNEEDSSSRIPNDGREEINIEPINWDDM